MPTRTSGGGLELELTGTRAVSLYSRVRLPVDRSSEVGGEMPPVATAQTARCR